MIGRTFVQPLLLLLVWSVFLNPLELVETVGPRIFNFPFPRRRRFVTTGLAMNSSSTPLSLSLSSEPGQPAMGHGRAGLLAVRGSLRTATYGPD